MRRITERDITGKIEKKNLVGEVDCNARDATARGVLARPSCFERAWYHARVGRRNDTGYTMRVVE